MKKVYKSVLFILFLFASAHIVSAQRRLPADTTIQAGEEYKKSSFFEWLWGKNYRKEWSTPVKVPVMDLEKVEGGLIAYASGGGNQTKSLRVKTKAEKEFSLRSVNKTLGKVLPDDFRNTFIEKIVNDKVSMSHPYAAVTVPPLAQSAGIYHSNPKYYFLPNQTGLDTFNTKFGNDLFLYEQRLSGSWKEAANLGNFEKFIDTDELLEKLYDDNDNQVDQKMFVKARLFDMFINDWDRHEKQWEWGAIESDNKKVYVPVPQDRDQAYFNYNGVLLTFLMKASGMKYFQQFKNNIPDVANFNYEERNLDRLFANELTLSDWQIIAKSLQTSLTDRVIEAAVKQLPPEIFPISGQHIISTLKQRRNNLENIATTYYNFIAKEVDVAGSKSREHFEINRLNENETSVNIFKINKEGEQKDKPFYTRTFSNKETEEIRLYGLSGKDSYLVRGDANNKIRIRLIGGDEKDSITNLSTASKVHVYDNADNVFQKGSGTKLHLSEDSSIHDFKFKSYLYDKKGFSPIVFYDNDDRLYVGLAYTALKNGWRKTPFAYKQKLEARYSVSQLAPRFLYSGLFPQAVGKWALALNAEYDAIKWRNFLGLGNHTVLTTKDRDYFRLRTEEWMAEVGLRRNIGANHFTVSGNYQTIRIVNDTSRFVAKVYDVFNNVNYNVKNYASAQATYRVHSVNDTITPTKGITFFGNATYTHDIKESNKSFTRLMGDLQIFVPLVSKFSLAISTGASTVTGNPEFYQYSVIGGGRNLRGYRRERFWGKTAFYNSNELRFISNVNSYIFNGKAGLVAFYDLGRVWMPNQTSDVIHTGYGAGIILAPFNKISANVTYAISKEITLIQLRINKTF